MPIELMEGKTDQDLVERYRFPADYKDEYHDTEDVRAYRIRVGLEMARRIEAGKEPEADE